MSRKEIHRDYGSNRIHKGAEVIQSLLSQTLAPQDLQKCQKISLKRRVGMRSHVGKPTPFEHIRSIVGVKRLRAGVSGHVQVEVVIHVKGLIQKRNSRGNDRDHQDSQVLADL